MSTPTSNKSFNVEDDLEQHKTNSEASLNGGFTDAQGMCYQEFLVTCRRMFLIRNERDRSANPSENQPINESPNTHAASSPIESVPSSLAGSSGSEEYLSGGSPIREWWNDDQRNAAIYRKDAERADWEAARELRRAEANETDHAAAGSPNSEDDNNHAETSQQGSNQDNK
ncbi:hypothetical protein PCANC_28695 [Puccinia coronata f. sp. avenae]|uniref:Uncharacterized protein n=1 Tax=Puccinia coronata f. sp. avenae TaxID=200324 RepID=A0A2N5RVV7_9BASI|nr:hypothetical protein PCANC_28695 [Puccinia coronata f. sp. avenae]